MTSISVTTSSTSRRSSASADTQLAGTAVHALWTGAADGDLRTIGSGPFPAGVPGDLVLRRARQVHDAGVLVVDSPVPDGAEPWVPGPEDAPPEGDAVVASGAGFALAVLTADCASVALASPEGVHGAVHVGWRGLGAGVLVRTIDTMRALGANTVVAGLGPCIGPCCYEFSGPHLDALASSCGPDVASRTTWGEPSLDLPAAVRGQLSRSGASLAVDYGTCTMCTPGYFSHRGRGDEARQALLVWRPR
jgi:copper oxidase (laccase) domain-containing protein